MKTIILITLLQISISAWGISSVPECPKRPDFLLQSKPVLSLKSLPQMVFVAKSAIYYVEDKVTSLRMLGEQSFVKGKSQIVCATGGEIKESRSFSLYAPTLIDLKDEKSLGDTYWQFHMVANPKQFGIWNKKSPLFSKTKDLELGLQKTGAQIQFHQISHDEYELWLSKESESLLETLVIRFDAVSKLP